jgi:hypothetical protein
VPESDTNQARLDVLVFEGRKCLSGEPTAERTFKVRELDENDRSVRAAAERHIFQFDRLSGEFNLLRFARPVYPDDEAGSDKDCEGRDEVAPDP